MTHLALASVDGDENIFPLSWPKAPPSFPMRWIDVRHGKNRDTTFGGDIFEKKSPKDVHFGGSLDLL